MNEFQRREFLVHFGEESGENLDALSRALLAMEGLPGDLGLFDEALRRCHSLKGTAKLAGAEVIESLAHAMETVLSDARRQRTRLGGPAIDLLFESVDFMRSAAEAVVRGEQPPAAAELESGLRSLAAASASHETALENRLPGLDAEVRSVLTEHQMSACLLALDAGKACWELELEVTPEDLQPRVREALRELGQAGEILGLAGLSPRTADKLRFKFLIAARLEEEAARSLALKLFLELRDPARAPEAPAPAAALSPEEEAFAAEVEALRLRYIDENAEAAGEFAKAILSLEKNPGDTSLIDDLFRRAHTYKGSGATFGLTAVSRLSAGMETLLEAVRSGKLKPGPRVVDALLKGADSLKDLFSLARAGNLAEDQPLPMAELEAALYDTPVAPVPVPAAVKHVCLPGAESIRVRLDKLDRLVNLASELTIARNTREAAVRGVEARVDQSRAALRQWQKLQSDIKLSPQVSGPLRDTGLMEKYEDLGGRLAGIASDLEALWNVFGTTSMHAEAAVNALQADVLRIRMVPVSMLFDAAPRIVRDLTSDRNKEVNLVVQGEDTELDKRVLELMADPLMHLLRNAVDHGIETAAERKAAGKPPAGTLRLLARQEGGQVLIAVEDDGSGMDPARLAAKAVSLGMLTPQEAEKLAPEQACALIFRPGFSTKDKVTDISGRGVGMDVVKSNIENLKGRIAIESSPGRGTIFRIYLPVSVSVAQVIIVESAGQTFCLQTGAVTEIMRVRSEDVETEENKACLRHRGHTVPLVRLSEILGLKGQAEAPEPFPAVIVQGPEGGVALAVDRAVEEQTAVLKGLGSLLKKVPHVAGGTILSDGRVAVILDPAGFVAAALRGVGGWTAPLSTAAGTARKSVLVVDDSLTTRELLRGILETAGYAVVTANNGREAWNLLTKRSVDLVVSDVTMPEMDGCELTARIRADRKLAKLPVVLVTALSTEAERVRGLQAGADAYIVKGAFDQGGLLQRVAELAGT